MRSSSGKDLLLSFLNHLFLLVIVAFFVFFFIAGDRFDGFILLMQSLAPLASFVLIFLIMLEFKRYKYRQVKNENSGEANDYVIGIRVDFFDRLKADVVIFSLPMISLLIDYFSDGKSDSTDIIQACVIFSVAYAWKITLFKKGEPI